MCSIQLQLLLRLHHSVLHLRVHVHLHFDSHVQLHIHAGFRWYSHFQSQVRVRSHVHMPSVDYTARELEADHAAKDRDF